MKRIVILSILLLQACDRRDFGVTIEGIPETMKVGKTYTISAVLDKGEQDVHPDDIGIIDITINGEATVSIDNTSDLWDQSNIFEAGSEIWHSRDEFHAITYPIIALDILINFESSNWNNAKSRSATFQLTPTKRGQLTILTSCAFVDKNHSQSTLTRSPSTSNHINQQGYPCDKITLPVQ